MWTRVKEQETEKVFRWYEEGNDVVSIVEGYFPNELNFRFSIGKNCHEIRGHKSVIGNMNEFEILQVIKRHEVCVNETENRN